MDKDFTGKAVLITGAARGLGAATARIFAERGASLFLVDVLAERLEQTRAELAASGAPCQAMAADISDRANCHAAVAAAVKAFGRLDVLCNVAAALRFGRVTDVPEADWAIIMAVNLSKDIGLQLLGNTIPTGAMLVVRRRSAMFVAMVVAPAA